MTEDHEMLSPPQLARRWKVSNDKILRLINNGSLKAINFAVSPTGRPRYRIRLSEIERFEEARTTKPPQPKQRRRRRTAVSTGREYF